MNENIQFYGSLLSDIKTRIQQAQILAALAVNAELVLLYWEIGKLILQRQQQEGWGSSVIPRLSADLRNALPEIKGFSERNIGHMIRFAREYGGPEFLQQPVANLSQPSAADVSPPSSVTASVPAVVETLLARIPWGHNIMLMEKLKAPEERLWYARQTLEQGWSRDSLASAIKSQTHVRQGAVVSNFTRQLPAPQSGLAQGLLKDPYLFDFLTLEEPFLERELETGLVGHLEKFLLELGQGFAFVGRQYELTVGDHDFYLDLLFYHLKLRAFVVVDLKKGPFKPEYAGKMNFYCSVVDDTLRHPSDEPTIGLILCQTKDRLIAEYALRDVQKPIGVADYELTRALPDNLKSSLPSIEQIEAELQNENAENGTDRP